MKKLSRTQLISTRTIHLVTSERGAIINDLPARMRSKSVWTQVSAGNTCISFCRAQPCSWREKASMLPSRFQEKAGISDKHSQKSSPSRCINDRKVTEMVENSQKINRGMWVLCMEDDTHTMNATLSSCFKHNEPVQALQLTNHMMYRIDLRLRVKSHHIPCKLYLKCDTSSHRLKSSKY